MARQQGILGLRGLVGGLSFAKNNIVRRAGEYSPERINRPSMARVRENNQEFTTAARAGKLLRLHLRRQLRTAADPTTVARLLKAMRALLEFDTLHKRGERRPLKSTLPRLVGFDFNLAAPLATCFASPYKVELTAPSAVNLALPALTPALDLRPPVEATHYELEVGVAILDFENLTGRSVAVTGLPAPAKLDSSPLAPLTIAADLGSAPGANEVVVVVLGLNFYLEEGGQLYLLNNGASNPLGLIYAQ